MSNGIHIQTLGITDTSKRAIFNCDAFNYLFPKATGQNITIKRDGNVADTVAAMRQIVEQTHWQTEKFAQYLKSKSKNTEDLLANIFAWFRGCIEYREDEYGLEQLRQSVRLWADKFGDCDCFSITVSCILTNLGIPHYFKVIKISNKPYYQHIYVVVPKNGQTLNGYTSYWTLDPVLDEFNREAQDITEVSIIGMGKLAGVNTLSGLPLQVLGNLPNTDSEKTSIYDGLFGNQGIRKNKKALGAVAVVKRDTGIVDTYNPNNNGIPNKTRTEAPVNFENGINPFQQIIEGTFKGTVSEAAGKKLAIRPGTSLQGLGSIDASNPENFETVFNSDELKQYATDTKGAVDKLNLTETKGAIQKLNAGYNYLKQNQVDPFASNLANLDNKPILEFFRSKSGYAIMTAVGAVIAGSTMVVITSVFVGICASTVVCGIITGAVIAAVVAILYIFTDNADEVIGNFWDWVTDKPVNLRAFDNYEGFSAKVDVNVYGDLIRTWREQATGSKSGNGYIEYPGDYFPVLASIYKNAPLPKGDNFIVNPNKVAVNAQMDSALLAAYGNEYWKTPGWMKLRAYMVTPLVAEIIYQQKYEEYKVQMMALFSAKAINTINWNLIDREYLLELRDTLKIQLLIAKKDQISYDNAQNNNKVNEPAVAGSILWIGGQNKDGVAQTGFFTNQTNLGLKPGDTVYIQITSTAGATEYTGMHQIAYLGTDDGLYINQMFTINIPKTAGIPSNITGVFQKQEPITPDPNTNSSKKIGVIPKLLAVASGIKILSLLIP